MKYFISFLLFFISVSPLFAQRIIKGKITDKETGEALPFATVLYTKMQGTVTNAEGFFSIEVDDSVKELQISYLGFEKQILRLQQDKNYYPIALKPAVESLGTVELTGKYVNPALVLLRKIVKRKKQNDYRKKLPRYSYTKYFKFLITADPDSVDAQIDSVFYNGKFQKTDSSLFAFKKEIADKDLYIMESVIKVNAESGEEKNKVIATRTAGLKNPMYELLALQVSNFHVYDDRYKFLIKKYLSPLTTLSVKQYQYELEDTLQIQGREVYVLSYLKKEKPLISGKIYVDSQSLAIARMQINTYKQFELQMTHSFHYYPEADVWFPEQIDMSIRKARKKSNIVLGDGGFNIEMRKRKDTLKHSNPNDVSDYLYATSKMQYSGVRFNRLFSDKIAYQLQVAPDAHKKPEDYWQQYTDSTRRKREINTYQYIDSISEKEGIEKAITQLRKAVQGSVPLGGYVDIDALHLIDKNQYEGWRVSLGGTTAEKFSERWGLSAYVAYGFKDKAIKYSGKIHYKLRHESQTFVHLSYTDDVSPTASFQRHATGFLSGIFERMSYDKFYQNKAWEGGFSHLIYPKLKAGVYLQNAEIIRKHPLQSAGGINFPEMDFSFVGLDLEWQPKSRFFLTPTGRETLAEGFPKFYFHLTKSLPALQSSTRDFYRVELQGVYTKKQLNHDETTLMVQMGYAGKQADLQHLYAPDSNGFYESSAWYNRLHFRLYSAFETMNNLAFADNWVSTLELHHNFARLHLGHKKRFDIKLIGRAAWGLSYTTSRYVGIQSLSKGYFETGVEFNRLVQVLGQGYGIGFYYRIGAYAYEKPMDNLSVKLTFDASEIFK